MNDRAIRTALRGVAIIIALVAAFDPTITSNRVARPDVSVVSSNPGDSVLVQQVGRELSRAFTVVRGSFVNAVATVSVGSHIASSSVPYEGPVFAVVPAKSGPNVEIIGVRIPRQTPLDARVPVVAALRVTGARGTKIETEISVGGTVVDRASRTIAADSVRVEVPLTFIPTSVGAAPVRISARAAGGEPTSADAVVDVRDTKWSILFFDPRPSWMSTFVRRALERDPRFVVTSRTVTSTNVSTDAGRPPAALSDPTVTELYDAIVVGAPNALSERDAAGLVTFLRQRGGSVVLLFDERRPGAYERIAGAVNWTGATNAQPVAITTVASRGEHAATLADSTARSQTRDSTIANSAPADSIAMRTSEWMWPAQLPDGALPVAMTGDHAVVWQYAVGAGRLVMSGALDGWKYRDPAQSNFERFWQTTIGDLASASPPAVQLELPASAVAPGADVNVTVTSRQAALSGTASGRVSRSTAAVTLSSGAMRRSVRVWPVGAPGVFQGSFRAPDSAGVYSVSATADGASATVPLVVSAASIGVVNDNAEVLAAWTAANGGSVVPSGRLQDLVPALRKAVTPLERRSAWHPMRSPWWLVPFALLLSAEWWLRRRKGLA